MREIVMYFLRMLLPTEAKRVKSSIDRSNKMEGKVPPSLGRALKELKRAFARTDLNPRDKDSVISAVEDTFFTYKLSYRRIEVSKPSEEEKDSLIGYAHLGYVDELREEDYYYALVVYKDGTYYLGIETYRRGYDK
jgi:hypothetical protein